MTKPKSRPPSPRYLRGNNLPRGSGLAAIPMLRRPALEPRAAARTRGMAAPNPPTTTRADARRGRCRRDRNAACSAPAPDNPVTLTLPARDAHRGRRARRYRRALRGRLAKMLRKRYGEATMPRTVNFDLGAVAHRRTSAARSCMGAHGPRRGCHRAMKIVADRPRAISALTRGSNTALHAALSACRIAARLLRPWWRCGTGPHCALPAARAPGSGPRRMLGRAVKLTAAPVSASAATARHRILRSHHGLAPSWQRRALGGAAMPRLC